MTRATATAPRPFAFTGNRFEFRAVGASQSVSGPLVAMNTMLADSLKWIADKLEIELAAGKTTARGRGKGPAGADAAARQRRLRWRRILGRVAQGSGRRARAAQPAHLRRRPAGLHRARRRGAVRVHGRAVGRGARRRYEVYAEQYVHSIEVEARLVVDMARTVIYPAALKYAADLATTFTATQALGVKFDTSPVAEVADNANRLLATVTELAGVLEEHDFADTEAHMKHSATAIRPLMKEARVYADALETMVDDAAWPLPKYREMLFIK